MARSNLPKIFTPSSYDNRDVLLVLLIERSEDAKGFTIGVRPVQGGRPADV